MRITKTGMISAGASGILAFGILIGHAMAYQEHMHAALDALRTAKGELEMAERNKGGHRENALRLTQSAIDEVQAGIEYDR